MNKATIALVSASVLVCGWGVFAQAPQMFELALPDFSPTGFKDGRTIIDVGSRPIRHMDVKVLNAQEKGITTGAIRVWVNGKGVGNILEGRNLVDSTVLSMTPATLKMRPDEIFDPRENTIEVLATDRRGRRYYQNWIVRTMGQRNTAFAYSATIDANDPAGIPPDIHLDLPTQPPVLKPGAASVEVVLKGTLSSAAEGTTFTVNKTPLAAQTIPATFAFEHKMSVRRGTTDLTLEAVDRKGHKRVLTIPVINQQNTATPPKFAGQKYALVIGISRFGDGPEAPPALYAAASDASEFSKQLVAKGKFKAENVRLLTDDRASLEQIRVGFYDFAAKAGKDDLLLIYVITYGFHDPRPGKPESLYLAAHGTRLSQLESTALAVEELDRLLDRSVKSNHTFLVFDAGHVLNGPWSFPGNNLINNRLLNVFSEQAGRAALVSGSSGELSQGRDADASHVFNAWLLEGLAGQADQNLDRVITAGEVFGFVTEKVRLESQDKQTPRFKMAAGQAAIPVF